jgi:hypothetical protein
MLRASLALLVIGFISSAALAEKSCPNVTLTCLHADKNNAIKAVSATYKLKDDAGPDDEPTNAPYCEARVEIAGNTGTTLVADVQGDGDEMIASIYQYQNFTIVGLKTVLPVKIGQRFSAMSAVDLMNCVVQ